MAAFGRILSVVFGVVALAAVPALADDSECVSLAKTMLAQTNQCKVESGSTYDYYRKDCLLQYNREYAVTATSCINAAQAHYEAAAGLDGYDADFELIKAATLEAFAGAANDFSGNCSLALSQLRSIITLLTSIVNDPKAGDLVSPAKLELSYAKTLLVQSKHGGC
jgi:hypothetical protein